MSIKLKSGADILDAMEDLSASAMAGLIDKRKMTDSARKELQRDGLLGLQRNTWQGELDFTGA